MFKKIFFSALSIIMISGFVNCITYAAEVIETDKGYSEYHESVVVKIVEPPQNAVGTDAIAIPYNFERTIAEIDQEYDARYGKKMSGIINDHSVRMVEVYENDRDVLHKFSDIFADCYSSKEMPDLSGIFNLGNPARNENMLLMQSWMYQLSIAQPSESISCKSEVKVKDVEHIDENVREIVFRLEQNISDGGHEQFSGIWFIADIVTDEGESRIINMWAEDAAFLMMRDRVERALQRYSDTIAEDLKNEILSDCERNRAAMLKTGPIRIGRLSEI